MELLQEEAVKVLNELERIQGALEEEMSDEH